MNKRHGVIRTLLKSIHSVKGPVGGLKLHARHWKPEAPSTRGVIAAGTLDPPDSNQTSEPCPSAGDTLSEGKGKWDGKLQVGEYIEFFGASPRSGHIHLFNLGTSGTCTKLAPSQEHPDNFVAPGSDFKLPSAQHLAREVLPEGYFHVTEPVSAEHGEPERLLVILTIDDIDLQIEDLHDKLEGRDLLTRSVSRGPSFGGPAKKGKTKLFRMPSERWEYGLLEMEVIGK